MLLMCPLRSVVHADRQTDRQTDRSTGVTLYAFEENTRVMTSICIICLKGVSFKNRQLVYTNLF